MLQWRPWPRSSGGGSAFGLLAAVQSFGNLAASAIAGLLWTAASPRVVVVLAPEEARLLNHNYIGTEHILLGLIREGEGVAIQVLVKLGADHARLREQVLWLLAGEGEQPGARTRLARMPVPADLQDYDEQIAQVRQEKETAIDAGYLRAAAALHYRERQLQLLAEKLRWEQEWTGEDAWELFAAFLGRAFKVERPQAVEVRSTPDDWEVVAAGAGYRYEGTVDRSGRVLHARLIQSPGEG
jgi:ATP-dependent Clp protease ATP-binding subunit ClpA